MSDRSLFHALLDFKATRFLIGTLWNRFVGIRCHEIIRIGPELKEKRKCSNYQARRWVGSMEVPVVLRMMF